MSNLTMAFLGTFGIVFLCAVIYVIRALREG